MAVESRIYISITFTLRVVGVKKICGLFAIHHLWLRARHTRIWNNGDSKIRLFRISVKLMPLIRLVSITIMIAIWNCWSLQWNPFRWNPLHVHWSQSFSMSNQSHATSPMLIVLPYYKIRYCYYKNRHTF